MQPFANAKLAILCAKPMICNHLLDSRRLSRPHLENSPSAWNQNGFQCSDNVLTRLHPVTAAVERHPRVTGASLRLQASDFLYREIGRIGGYDMERPGNAVEPVGAPNPRTCCTTSGRRIFFSAFSGNYSLYTVQVLFNAQVTSVHVEAALSEQLGHRRGLVLPHFEHCPPSRRKHAL